MNFGSSGSKPFIVEAGELISSGSKPFIVEASELSSSGSKPMDNFPSALREFWIEAMINLLITG